MKKPRRKHHGPKPQAAKPPGAAAPSLQLFEPGSKRRKVLVAIPCGSGRIHYTTAAAIHCIYTEAHQNGWEIGMSIRSTDSIISRARNVMFSQFVGSDADDLLFLDDDVGFAPGVFTRLMSHKVELVCGIYPVRGSPERYPVRPLNGWLGYDSSGSGLMEVEAAPTGLMRITRTAAEAMVRAYSDKWYEDATAPGVRIHNVFDFELIGREYFSEDFVFCRRFTAIGGKVWIDPDLPLSHSGDTKYTGNFGDFLRNRYAAQQGQPAPAPEAQPRPSAPQVPVAPPKLSELARSFVRAA